MSGEKWREHKATIVNSEHRHGIAFDMGNILVRYRKEPGIKGKECGVLKESYVHLQDIIYVGYDFTLSLCITHELVIIM